MIAIAIVPAYNEADQVGSVVRSLFDKVSEVVVIDDGSSDSTAEAALAAGAIVIVHPINRGQGAALETGHAYARSRGADLVVHFDADGQFDPADIPSAIQALEEAHADILLGSRFLDRRSQIPWLKRCLLFPLGRLIHALTLNTRLTDVHNGFRVLTKRALSVIYLTQDRMAHATEIIALSEKNRLKIIEFPVKVEYREYGQGISGGLGIIRDLFMGKYIR